MTIHLVYAGMPDDPRIQSPYSITKHLYDFLKTKAPVDYAPWDSSATIQAKKDDVILGHPHYQRHTPIQKAFRGPRICPRFLIHPLHTNRVGDNMPFDILVKNSDGVFSICGEYWYDTLGRTPFAHWGSKITRLDMAIDCKHFPFVQTQFNPVGKRRLIYIGSSMPQKNLGFLTAVMQAMPNVQLHWYGGSSDHQLARLRNVKVTGWVTLNAQMATKIVSECDIFVNTSISDANPTTLLEACAWGLIPACTKESGYYNNPMFTELYLGDISKTVQVIQGLLKQDGNELLQRARQSRETVVNKYNWDVFCNTVWNGIKEFVK